MGNSSLLCLPTLCFLLLLSLDSGGNLKLVHGEAAGKKQWCVAKPSSSDEELNNNINFCCSNVPCTVIQPSGSCYSPESLINHASVVMNLYYQENGKEDHTCDFKNSGMVSITDPSYDACTYEYKQ